MMTILVDRAELLAEAFGALLQETAIEPMLPDNLRWLSRAATMFRVDLSRSLGGVAATYVRRLPAELRDDPERSEEAIRWLQAALAWLTEPEAPPPPPIRLRAREAPGSGPGTGSP